jgi:hypothetical protein
MRTVLIILGGFVLWGLCLGISRLLGGGNPGVALWATVGFVAAWFAVSAINMWAGVTTAGYTFQEELPIFLIIFLLPTAFAALVKWKWL